ncbi:MAG: peptide deformylase [Clostridiales Family XIII bacterium]|jgi:peptide deformylase|nr:peptide deformylase [Clostridiales Family XIII bacterium]
MALRNIVTDEDAILRKASREVKEVTPRIRELIGDLWETMYEKDGVGLAAPQVGVLRRVAVVDATPRPVEPEEGEAEAADEAAPPAGADAGAGEPDGCPPVYKYTLVNPVVVWRSEEESVDQEGCLSVPGYSGKVSRPVRVRVRALDEEGQEYEVEGEGLLARALCHEIDHLDGVLYTDLAESVEEIKAENPDG